MIINIIIIIINIENWSHVLGSKLLMRLQIRIANKSKSG